MIFSLWVIEEFWKIPKFIIGTLVNYTLVKILVNWPLDTFIHVFLHCIHSVDLFSDPGFGQNMLRDSGKRKSYWEKTRSDCYPGSRIHQNLGSGRETVFFPLSIRNSVNRKMRNRQMWINRFVIWRGYEKLCQNINWSFLPNGNKNGIRESDEKKCGMRDFREKEQKCGIRTSCTRSLWYFYFYIYLWLLAL